jgi:hypothetical protein
VLKADGFVWRSVEQFVRDGAAALQSDENRTLAEDRYVEAIAEVERAEQELAAWTSNELVSVLGEETFLAGYRQRDAALVQAKEAVSSCASSIVEMPPPDFDFDALNAEERRTLIDMLIERIEVDRGRGDGRLRILWRTLL